MQPDERLSIEDLDFETISDSFMTVEEAAQSLASLFALPDVQKEAEFWVTVLNPIVEDKPDAIPLSDTEYAGFGSGAWSMETGNPLDLKGIV